MAYKTIRRDGRNITIDTATGQEVGVGQGQLKPIFDALGLSNLNETLPLTLKQMGADIQNLPGDISRHLIYSDKVDEKGRPLTIAQANPQPRKLIPEIESYLAREGKSKPVGTKDQPKFADLRGKFLVTAGALLICRLLDKGYTMRRCLRYVRHVAKRTIVPMSKFNFTSERLFIFQLSKRIRAMRRKPHRWGLHLRPFDRYLRLRYRHFRR